MAFGSDKMQIVVEVDAQGAIRVLDQLGTEIKGVEQKSQQAGQGITKFQGNVLSLEAGVSLAREAISGLSTAVGSIASGLERGSRVDDIASSFERLAQKAGMSAEALSKSFGDALGNTISQVEEMRIANELMVGGIDPRRFEMLGKAARALGEQLGTDAAEGMERLNDSLLRGNTRALKSIGIIIDETKAVEDFARAHGRAAEDVSDLGRVVAIREASMSALSSEQEKFGTVVDDAGDKIQQFNAQLTNFGNEFWKSLAANQQVNEALDNFNRTLKETDFSPVIEGLASVIKAVDNVTRYLAEGVQMWRDFFKAANNSSGLQSLQKAVDNLDPMKMGAKLGNALRDWADGAEVSAESAALLNREGVKLNENFGKATPTIKSVGDAAKKVAPDMAGLFNASKGGQDAAKKMKEDLSKVNSLIEQLAQTSGNSKMTGTFLGIFDQWTIKSADQIALDLKKAADELIRAGTPADEVASSLREAATEAGKLKDNAGQVYGPANDAGVQEWKKSQPGGWFSQRGEVDWEQEGANIAQTLFDGIHKGMNSKDWKQLAGDVGGQIGGALGAQFGPIGQVVGQFLGKTIFEGLADFFSAHHSAGTNARKAVDAYFADLFNKDHVMAVINGQLSNITDMTFSEMWHDGIATTLPADVQTTFNSVGAAYEEMLNQMGIDTSAMSGQLGTILMNNLGGSLENLRVMLEATGKTAEDMGNALLQAFLNGKISAEEYLIELQKINGIMGEKGIIGKTGAVAEAWKRFMEMGFKGGRGLTDSIQGIAQELLEAGANMGTMADIMVNRFGIAANNVAAFMEAMKVMGITSIEQLLTMSQEELAQFAANLQSIMEGKGPIGKVAIQHTATTASMPRSTGSSVSTSSTPSETINQNFLKFIREYKDNLEGIAIAAREAGSSFEKMQDQATQAFLRGSEDAQAAYNRLQDVGPGIAGKKGAVGEAVNSYLAAGTKGGYVTVERLKGIAKEVQEAGGKTLDDMNRFMLAQGIDATTATKMVQAMSRAGITSMDDLYGVSNIKAIEVVKNMQEMNVPFKQTSKDISDMIQQINSIPKSKEVEVNVKLKLSKQDEAILKSLDLWKSGYSASSPGAKAATR